MHPMSPEPAAASADAFPTVASVRRTALARLDEHAVNYLEGGAGAERTLRANEAAFDRWTFRPRMLTGHATADTSTTLFGVPLASPIVVAPFGLDALFHPDGLCAVVRGAAQAGTAAFVSTSSSHTLEDVHAAAPDAAMFLQVSALGPTAVVERVAKRAADAGYRMLCITIDTPRPGWRERAREDPAPPSAVDLASANYGPDDYKDRMAGGVAWTWDTVAAVGSGAGIPWVVKGVLTGDDARLAIEHGAAGIVVSNHGGRQLDGAPAALDALPEVVAAAQATQAAQAAGGGPVDRRIPVLMDGGIRHGGDALVALALGATAVGIGRPAAWGLTVAGADGVARVLNLLREELEIAMTLAGRPTIDAIDATLLEHA